MLSLNYRCYMKSFFRIISGLFLLALMSACGGGGGSPGATGSKTILSTSANSTVTVAAGQSQTFTITGGVPNYLVTSSNISALTVTSTNANSSTAAQFTVTGISSGAATIKIVDNAGTIISIAVTVSGTTSTTLATSAAVNNNLAVGAAGVYRVTGGTPPWTVFSSNQSAAGVSISNNVITVTGKAVGSSTITVFDSLTQSASFAVQVASSGSLATAAPSSITVGSGNSTAPGYQIFGGSQVYAVASANTAIATASCTTPCTAFTVFGISPGTTNVQISDTAGASVQINVTVTGTASTPLYTTAPLAITMSVGTPTNYLIGGGTPNTTSPKYFAVSSNTSVLTASVDLTGILTISPLASGVATVTIKDAVGAALTPISVTVSGGTTNAMYTTAPASISLNINDTPSYLVSGGVPFIDSKVAQYQVVSSNASIAQVVSTPGSANFTVIGVASGSATLQINDSTGTKPITIKVTVGTTGVLFYTSAPGTLTIGAPLAGVTPTASVYALGGGTPPYNASSSDVTVATVVANPNSLQITGISPGTATVQIVDAAGTPLSTKVNVVATTSTTMAVSPSAVGNAYVGDVLTFRIDGGTPPYTVISNNPASVSIPTGTVSASGGTFTATMANINTGVIITVSDKNGAPVQVTIGTIAAKSASLTLSPSSFILGQTSPVATPAPVPLTLSGGNAPFQAFTDNPVVSVNDASTNLPVATFFTNRSLSVVTQSSVCTSKTAYTVNGVTINGAKITITVIDNLNNVTKSLMYVNCP